MRSHASFNSQNYPRDWKHLWLADDDRFYLVTGDLSQVEARWTAFYARDAKMTQAFFDGADLHAMMAAAVYKCAPTKAASEALFPLPSVPTWSARDICKRVRHGRNFGMEKKKMALTTGLPEALCAELIEADKHQWPATTRWQVSVIVEAIETGKLTTVFVRSRRFSTPPPNPDPVTGQRNVFAWADAREALSHKPQSSTASQLFRIQAAMWEELKRLNRPEVLKPLEYPWATTHDAVTLCVPKVELDFWGRFLRRHMTMKFPQAKWERFYPDGFWCPTDIKYGTNWACTEKWKGVGL